MVARTQITLDPEAHRRAKARAAELAISLAEYFRRLVAKDLGPRRRASDPSDLFDLGDSGGSDIARQKADYVAAAFTSRSGARARPRRARKRR